MTFGDSNAFTGGFASPLNHPAEFSLTVDSFRQWTHRSPGATVLDSAASSYTKANKKRDQ